MVAMSPQDRQRGRGRGSALLFVAVVLVCVGVLVDATTAPADAKLGHSKHPHGHEEGRNAGHAGTSTPAAEARGSTAAEVSGRRFRLPRLGLGHGRLKLNFGHKHKVDLGLNFPGRGDGGGDEGVQGRSGAAPADAWQKVGPNEPAAKMIPVDGQREWVHVGASQGQQGQGQQGQGQQGRQGQ